jgi:hypothetical protein
MSEASRILNLGRAFVNREMDRLNGVAPSSAEKELLDALENPVVTTRIVTKTITLSPEEAEAQAKAVLGVETGASFSSMKTRYTELKERCEAVKFKPGSEDDRQISILRKRIDWAYGVLSARADSTEKRFGSLEID